MVVKVDYFRSVISNFTNSVIPVKGCGSVSALKRAANFSARSDAIDKFFLVASNELPIPFS
jgi:hypothetical protein